MRFINMKTLIRIALSRIKRNSVKSTFQSFGICISSILVTSFLILSASLEDFIHDYSVLELEAVNGENKLTVDSIVDFFKSVILDIEFISIAAALLFSVSVFVYANLCAEENKRFNSVLSSIGATMAQRRFVTFIERLIVYFVPAAIGSIVSVFPGYLLSSLITDIFADGYEGIRINLAIPIFVILICLIFIVLSVYIPHTFRKKSVIESVKQHNKKEQGNTHSYRASYTFRNMPIEKRIAKKSVQYYGAAYNRIGFMFVSCALYPVLAVVLFSLMSERSVTDYTPSSGIDAIGMVENLSGKVALFGVVALALLCVIAVFQTSFIIKIQSKVRGQALRIYKNVGMTEEEIKRILKYEYRTVLFHTFICLAFILSAIFVFLI
ncbi:MAG: ABC transporter permease [Ruminococcaceae bacterium]|nr:ABC transporter permease [Oscillospiraceae bacterium]